MALDGNTTTFLPYTLNGLQEIAADSQVVSTLQVNSLTPGRVVVSDGSDYLVSGAATTTEVDYLSGATSNIQAQLNAKPSTSYVDTNFLNKTTSSDQTVAGKVSYMKELVVSDERVVNLASKVVVDANYQNLITSASVSVGQNFGTITNALGVYQSTTDIASGMPILIAFPITSGKRYSFTIEMLIEDPTYTWYVDFYQSVDNINPVTDGVIGNFIFPQGSTSYTLSGYTFQALTTGNVIIPVSNDAPSPSNQAVKWKNLTVYEEGVALTNVSMPAQLADRVVVLNEKKQLVSSGISTTKLGYLDNVSSDIQTQLNSKLANTSGQAFGTFDFTSTVPILFSGFSGSRALITNASKQLAESAVTSTELGYVSGVTSAIQTQLNAKASTTYVDTQDGLRVLKSGDTMTGTLAMGANKVTSSAVPTTGSDLTNKTYVDGAISGAGALYVLKSGDTMTGNLGIGTSPTYKLDVLGVGRFYGTGRGWIHENGTVRLESYISASGGWLGTYTNHSLHFYTNNSNELMTLDTSGNLGIGHTPTVKLDVNGALRVYNAGGEDFLRLYNGSVAVGQYINFRFNFADSRSCYIQANIQTGNRAFLQFYTADGGGGIGNRLQIQDDFTVIKNNLYVESAQYMLNDYETTVSPSANTGRRMLLRESDGYVRYGQCGVWRYENNSIAWTGGIGITNVFYKQYRSIVVMNLNCSFYTSGTGAVNFEIQIIPATVGLSIQTRYYRQYVNIAYNHIHVTIPLVWDFSWAGGAGWYNLYMYASGAGVTSDFNDVFWINTLVIG